LYVNITLWGYDTFVYLLDSNGTLIDSDYNNNNGLGGYYDSPSYIKIYLDAGTYYVVSERYMSKGNVTTKIEGFLPGTVSEDKNYILSRIFTNETGTTNMDEFQYFDGIGRPLQTVAVAASPNEKDIVNPIVYDKIGREAKKYLPYEADTDNGAYKPDYLTKQQSFYDSRFGATEKAWTEIGFEDSPLNRVLYEKGPGKEWYTNQRSVTYDYKTNAVNEVRLWKAETNQVSSTVNYNANTLHITATTDEDGRIITDFHIVKHP